VDTKHASASDNNAGSESLPWKTITKANQALVAGDTVYIKSGTYGTYISPNNSGTSSLPITYRNYGNDTVTTGEYVPPANPLQFQIASAAGDSVAFSFWGTGSLIASVESLYVFMVSYRILLRKF
jgi:hypothetical protein